MLFWWSWILVSMIRKSRIELLRFVATRPNGALIAGSGVNYQRDWLKSRHLIIENQDGSYSITNEGMTVLRAND